jgi:hypothetical protein
MTDPTLAYARVRCVAGHQHRRHVRWSEVDPSVRLPQQQWRWRWRLDDRCAVAVASSLEGQVGLFQPCAGRPLRGMDLCQQHAQLERRVSGRVAGHSSSRGGRRGSIGCQAPLLALDAPMVAGAEVDDGG